MTRHIRGCLVVLELALASLSLLNSSPVRNLIRKHLLLRTVYLNADIHCQDSLLSEGLGPPNERVSFGLYIIALTEDEL
jgi:hypothetical protein